MTNEERDERMDRLKERTDSIAQSVELLTHDVHGLQEVVKKHQPDMTRLITMVEEMQPLVKSFMVFTVDHERRLRAREGQ